MKRLLTSTSFGAPIATFVLRKSNTAMEERKNSTAKNIVGYYTNFQRRQEVAAEQFRLRGYRNTGNKSSERRSKRSISKRGKKEENGYLSLSKLSEEAYDIQSVANFEDDEQRAHKRLVHYNRNQNCGSHMKLLATRHGESWRNGDREVSVVCQVNGPFLEGLEQRTYYRADNSFHYDNKVSRSIFDMLRTFKYRWEFKYLIHPALPQFSAFILSLNWWVKLMGNMREPLFDCLWSAPLPLHSKQALKFDLSRLSLKGGHSNFVLWGSQLLAQDVPNGQ